MLKKCLTELVGTFFLVFTIGLVVASGSPFAALAIGFVLVVLVYMGGHVSGAHYNPAVSTALVIAKKMDAKDYGPYVVSQLIGSVLAALAAYVATGKTFAPSPGPGVGLVSALVVEALFTLCLVLVIFNVAASKKTQGNGYFGLAIGGTVLAAAFAGGPISGGAFNPAVGLGPSLVNAMLGQGSLSSVWLYIVGPIVGALLAIPIFKAQDEAGPEEPQP